MLIKNPFEILEAARAGGADKVRRTVREPSRLLLAAVAAGVYIAMGGTLSLVAGFGFPEAAGGNPALQKLLAGATFPIGLILVVVLGAELFTGNNAVLMPGYLERDFPLRHVLANWGIVYVGNFIGAVGFTWLLVYCAGLTAAEPWHGAIIGIGVAKTSMPWWMVFVKGIGANWFVCLGVWLALSGHNLLEKAFGCWLPVMAFVALGYEHCIANMFYLPLALMEGAPVSVADCLWRNLLPSTLGNIAGGAIFVGMMQWRLFRR